MWKTGLLKKRNPKKENLEKPSKSGDPHQAAHFPTQNGNEKHHMNVIICSLFHYEHFLKLLLKSVLNFPSYLATSQTDINAGKNIYLPGGGKNTHHQDVLTLAGCAETTKMSQSV